MKSNDAIKLMEVCGTHTVSVFRHGIRELLPENVKLISGPGCPVCVTPNEYIDKAFAYAKDGQIIVTFGDMFRVPGSSSSLERERAKGSDVRIVYSPLDALDIAKQNPARNVIFLGIGFETTAPLVASTIIQAKKENLENFYVLCGHKTIPSAIDALLADKQIDIDGFILPGHVSTIIGKSPYGFIAKKHKKPAVITGFEASDILEGIKMLLRQIKFKKPIVEIQYKRAVEEKGNAKAVKIMEKVFEPTDSQWRGIGIIKNSGLKIRKGFSKYDAENNIKVIAEKTRYNKGCVCGEVIKGTKIPTECRLFAKSCRPENPKGACMVSSEGTCAAYYKYGR